MQNNKSLYDIISDNMVDGVLKEDFSLASFDDQKIKWADGASDGVAVYHMQPYQSNEKDLELIEKAVQEASSGKLEEAHKTFAELGEQAKAISIVDDLHEYIISHASELNQNNLFKCAMDMIINSSYKECVKFGMEIIEIFNFEEGAEKELIKDMVREIGQCNEFTIFAVWIMSNWENGNDEIFDLARKVSGWGRIHAVENLEPSTEEIRKWILLEGTKNTIVNSYSAYTCWTKSNASEKLRSDITYEEFEGIAEIVYALLDEGPVLGISAVDNADENLLNFLSQSEKFDLKTDDYNVILYIDYWASYDESEHNSVKEACDKILKSEACRETIKEAIKIGEGIKIANALGIDSSEELYNCMKNDFDKNFHQCRYLINNPDYVEKTVDLFRNNLPLSDMYSEPEDITGLGEEYKDYMKLRIILQELKDKLFVGEDLVISGLWSKPTGTRNIALKVIQSWVKTKQIPLKELSEKLYNEVSKLGEKEVSQWSKDAIDKLLSGMTDFSEEE